MRDAAGRSLLLAASSLFVFATGCGSSSTTPGEDAGIRADGGNPDDDAGAPDPDGGGGDPDSGGDPDGSLPDDAGVPEDAAPPDAPPEPPDDCDPDGPIHPGADELIDGLDNDCDGLIDEIDLCAGGSPTMTLNGAIAAAPSGGTIFVCAGTYNEHLSIIGKPLHLVGVNGSDTTIIDAGGTGTAVTVDQTGGAGVTLEGFTIRNGFSAVEGGGVRCTGSTLQVIDSVIVTNEAEGGGGLYASGCTLDIGGTRFAGNDGGETGGGLMLVASSGSLHDSTMITNEAVYGGGVYSLEGSVTIANNVMQTNTALLRGGGLFHESNATVSGNTVTTNDAQWTGGGMYIVQHAPMINGNSVIDNTSFNDGGGIYVHQGTSQIIDNDVIGNTTEDDGGGIRIFEAAAHLEANLVEDNYAGDGGGGIRVSHVPSVLIDNIVRNNVAVNTGGGMDLDNDSSLVRGGEISGNNASSGGGIFAWLGPWTGHRFENIVISGNHAWRGGGLFIDDNFMPVRMSGLTVIDNTAGKGAGLHIRATNYTLTNSLFANNEASQIGGGLFAGVNSEWWEECTPQSPCPPLNPIGNIDFVVFRGNEADEGSAVWTDSAGLSVESSILVDNVGNAVTVAAPVATPDVISPPVWRFNDTVPATFVGIGDPTGSSGNISADPMFMDPVAGDYHLAAGSPCVDTANPEFVDADGTPADMGMYGGGL